MYIVWFMKEYYDEYGGPNEDWAYSSFFLLEDAENFKSRKEKEGFKKVILTKFIS